MVVDASDSAESSRSGDPPARSVRAGSPDPVGSLDSGSAPRLVWSAVRPHPALLVGTTLSGALWMLPTALLPLVIGYAIDTGIGGQQTTALVRGVLLVVLLALVQTASAAVLEWTQHTLWMHGTATLQRAVHHRITRLGGALPKRMPSGEAVAVGSSDTLEIGDLFEVLGRAAGAAVSFLVAVTIMLSLSPVLGVLVLIGVPLATIGIAPLLRPLHRREERQRERLGEVNALASDIVSGLRILRGVGGEQGFHARFVRASQSVRDAGVAVGRIVSWLAGAEILLPGLVTVLVTWIGARLALTGAISVGELVAFYGMSAFLVIPVRTATEAAGEFSASMVGAGRVRELLRLRRYPPPPEHPLSLPSGPLALHDGASRLGFPAGELTVLDTGTAAEPVAERLAGHVFGARPVRAGPETDGTGGVSLAEVAPHELRGRIVLVHHHDVLFAGPPRDELDLGTAVTPDAALEAAEAHEVLDALPAGAVLDEGGRVLSGGQRQRLILARALCADADVLVLDEPTSAVDAHTEARIARRVRELRAGKTTIVLSQSPLWTAVADQERAIG